MSSSPNPDPKAPLNTFGWNDYLLRGLWSFAVVSGWHTYYYAAESAHNERASLIFCLDTRESAGSWKSHPNGHILGDHEEAIGLGQLHALKGQNPQSLLDPEANIMETASRLAANRITIGNLLKDHNATATPADVDRLVVAAYNRGPEAVFEDWQKGNPDARTEHGNYAADILGREADLIAAGVFGAGPSGPDSQS